MEPEAGFLLVPLFIAIAIGIRLFAGVLNHERIKEYIANKGGKVTEIQWSPFGPGWFGEKSDAIYEIKYRDRDGNKHVAYCKTSMFTGVYITEDKIVKAAQQQPQGSVSLEEENRRLKEELRRLRAER